MRVIFMGTPEFSVPALDALADAGHDIVCVYTQPPRPAGRGKKERPSAVHQRADTRGIPVRHPASLKDKKTQAEFAGLEADIAVVVAYGLILPQPILDAPELGCLNIHASLLPRWRGAAPIHRAIMAGDAQAGVCIMQMDAGLDTGPVLMRDSLNIAVQETTDTLHDKLSEMGARLIVSVLSQMAHLTATAQPDDGVTYAAKIDKAEARIDWTQPAEEVDRMIRGLSPFPGAWFEHDGARIKVLGSKVAEGKGKPGEVLDDEPTIACGDGAVQLTRLQRAGKAVQDAAVFQRGVALDPGTVLGG